MAQKNSLRGSKCRCMQSVVALRRLFFLTFAVFLFLGPPTASSASGEKRTLRAADAALQAARQGALARKRGDLAASCRAFSKAVQLTPKWALAQLELGRCLRLLGAPYSHMSRHLELALRWFPGWSLVHIEAGLAAEDSGLKSVARASYRKALTLNPKDIRAQAGLTRVSPTLPLDAQITHLKSFLRRHPHSIAATRQLARALEKKGAFDQAETLLRQVLRQSRHKTAAAAALGKFGQRTGRPLAIETAQKALKRP